MTFGETWKCHVCGRERPDSAISVYSSVKTLTGVPFTQNVRYCNDNPACIEGAKTIDFFHKGEEVVVEEQPWWKRVLAKVERK